MPCGRRYVYLYTSFAPYEGHRISHHKLSQVYRPFSNGSPWPVVAPVMRRANAGVWRGDGENLLTVYLVNQLILCISYEHHEHCFDNHKWCQILSIKSIISLDILRALDMTTDFKKMNIPKMQWQTQMTRAFFRCFKSSCRSRQWIVSNLHFMGSGWDALVIVQLWGKVEKPRTARHLWELEKKNARVTSYMV